MSYPQSSPPPDALLPQSADDTPRLMRFALSINEVVGDEQSAARTSDRDRLPITVRNVVRARAERMSCWKADQ